MKCGPKTNIVFKERICNVCQKETINILRKLTRNIQKSNLTGFKKCMFNKKNLNVLLQNVERTVLVCGNPNVLHQFKVIY